MKNPAISVLRTITLYSALAIGLWILLGYDLYPNLLSNKAVEILWVINSLAVFILMCIRPLMNLLPNIKILRALIPYRKELGILTGMIVVMFGLAKYIAWGLERSLSAFFSLSHWGLSEGGIEPIFWGRVGFITGVILLLTSNNISIRLLGPKLWKNIQRLSYIYFFAGTYYVWAVFDHTPELIYMIIVAVLTVAAFIVNKRKKMAKAKKNA